MNKKYYYNGNKVLNTDCFLNFILGARGWGKTYFYKTYALKNFLDKGEEFIYLRRTNTELQRVKDRILSDVQEDWFMGYRWKVEGDKIKLGYGAEDNKFTEVCGYCIPLSITQNYKSVPFEKVTTVIFDEFIIMDGNRYLKNEVERFLDFMSTVVRTRDNVRVFLLANMISNYNIYFNYFGVKLEDNQKFYQKDQICVDDRRNTNFEKEAYQTRFGQLIKNTRYGEFNIENKSLRENNLFIKRKPGNSRYMMYYQYHGKNYGIWHDPKEEVLYISTDFIDNDNYYVFNEIEMSHNSIMIKRINQINIWRSIKNYYYNSKIFYENQLSKTSFMNVMSILGA